MSAIEVVLFASFLGKEAWVWLLFIGIVIALLAFDLGVLHRDEREIGVAESLLLSLAYFAIACGFGAWIWWDLGSEPGLQYFTGLFVEKSLALDNVFIISLIFTYLAIPRAHQYRVLFWGILGVIVLRAIMIGLGAALVAEFSWILYVFGAFLLFTGIKMLFFGDRQPDIAKNPMLRYLRGHLRLTDRLHGQRFWVRRPDPATGRMALWFTPLFLALVLVEFADLVFAVDSVPAIFAITTDPYIVYTSNIFAILGLRALYFALAAMVRRFRYLHYALGAVLIFIGAKIFYNQLYGKLDPAASLAVTGTLLLSGVVASLLVAPSPTGKAAKGPERSEG